MQNPNHGQRQPYRAFALLAIAALIAVAFPMPTAEASGHVPIRFGMDAGSVAAQGSLGAAPDLGVLWIGPWTLESGWGGPGATLSALRAAGVTPVIHFFYWGNDISQGCIENGCWSSVHQAWKSRSAWQTLAQGLVDQLHARMGGRDVVIILETEFNKGNAQTYEPLDGYLASKAWFFRNGYAGATIVLGFGNWASWNWDTFDRAAAASHWVGLQAIRGSTRDSYGWYAQAFDATKQGMQTLRTLFGKPVLLTDLALSSYPHASYAGHQSAALGAFFDRMDELRALDLVGILYRSLDDNPNANTGEYYGTAERHWGLRASGGSAKPALWQWVNGVQAERGGGGSGGGGSSPPASGNVWLEVESFATRTAGGRQSSTSASGGAFWNLWGNGYVQRDVSLAPGVWDLEIRAKGTPAAGVAPLMVAKWDGTRVMDAAVGTSWTVYTTRVTVEHGDRGPLRISFTNDGTSGPEDRNLWLDRVQLLPSRAATVAEAESFPTRTTGGRHWVASASGDAVWNLWSNGYVERWLPMRSGGTYDVTVWATGTRAAGVGPHLVLAVDGATRLHADPAGTLSPYTVRVTVGDGDWHPVRVRFTNDATSGPEDRNLWVDRVELRPA